MFIHLCLMNEMVSRDAEKCGQSYVVEFSRLLIHVNAESFFLSSVWKFIAQNN